MAPIGTVDRTNLVGVGVAVFEEAPPAALADEQHLPHQQPHAGPAHELEAEAHQDQVQKEWP